MLSEDEINIMERIDLAPDALAKSPPEEKQLAEEYLPRIRALRQDIGEIASLDNLKKVAADASLLAQEFRLRDLQLKGVDLHPVMELAKKVRAGELTLDKAKVKVLEMAQRQVSEATSARKALEAKLGLPPLPGVIEAKLEAFEGDLI